MLDADDDDHIEFRLTRPPPQHACRSPFRREQPFREASASGETPESLCPPRFPSDGHRRNPFAQAVERRERVGRHRFVREAPEPHPPALRHLPEQVVGADAVALVRREGNAVREIEYPGRCRTRRQVTPATPRFGRAVRGSQWSYSTEQPARDEEKKALSSSFVADGSLQHTAEAGAVSGGGTMRL